MVVNMRSPRPSYTKDEAAKKAIKKTTSRKVVSYFDVWRRGWDASASRPTAMPPYRSLCSDEPYGFSSHLLAPPYKKRPLIWGRILVCMAERVGYGRFTADCDASLSKLMLRRTYGSHPTCLLHHTKNDPYHGSYALYVWRRGWDSNPRCPHEHGGFQDRCLKPLDHLSG